MNYLSSSVYPLTGYVRGTYRHQVEQTNIEQGSEFYNMFSAVLGDLNTSLVCGYQHFGRTQWNLRRYSWKRKHALATEDIRNSPVDKEFTQKEPEQVSQPPSAITLLYHF